MALAGTGPAHMWSCDRTYIKVSDKNVLAGFEVRAFSTHQVPGLIQGTSRRIHTFSLGRHHLLNTEVLQHNFSLLPLDHHLLPHSLNSYKPHKGGGTFDRWDPTDSAVCLKSDQSANKKKWVSWPQAVKKVPEPSRGTLFIIFPAPVSLSITLLKYLICGRLFLYMLGFFCFYSNL